MWKSQPFCTKCKETFNGTDLQCTKCGEILRILPIKGPSKSIIEPRTLWSFGAFLPKFQTKISLSEGNTPVLDLSKDQKLKGIKTKLDFRNPTGSFRDRASTLILSDAYQKKVKTVVGASTGSFSISLSAYSANAKINNISIIPSNLELSKIEQMKIYGSEVIEKGETVEEAITESERISKEKGYYLATPEKNILAIEGQKTIGLELALQIEDIEAIILPRGSGSLIYSVFRGLEDANESGWITEFPRIFSISLQKTKAAYLAESLEVKQTVLHEEVKKIISFTKGREIEIDASIMIEEAMSLAKTEGMFIEPASGSVIAAARVLKTNDEIDASRTVVLLSGTGFNALNIFASQMRGQKKVVWGLAESSTTKFEILNLIAEKKANYGYAIREVLGKNQSIQSIYEHLQQLEERGIISVLEIKHKRKIYELTRKGYETLERMRNLIDLI